MWLFTAIVVANAARMLAAYQTGRLYIGWLPPSQFRFTTKADDPQLWRNHWIAAIGLASIWLITIAYRISN
jgi:hypothetical protein